MRLIQWMLITFLLYTVGGCFLVPTWHPESFRVAIVNDTPDDLHGVTCVYPGGRGLGGEMRHGPDIAKIADANRPTTEPTSAIADANRPTTGPIHVAWDEGNGVRYEVDIPFKASYVIRPQGILLIRIFPDHTVGVGAVPGVDFATAKTLPKGDIFPAERTALTTQPSNR